MIYFAFLCIFLFTETHLAASIPNANYEYSQEANAWLRLHMVPATWPDAGMRCYLEGGVLTSPTTSALAQVMLRMMAKHKVTRSVFTGINSIVTRTNFTTLEGVELSSIPLSWAPGEPDNMDENEDCVVMTGNGTLADTSCDNKLPYFCSKKYTQLKKKKHSCGTGDHDYTDSDIGSCYRFDRKGRSWRDALTACYTDGGYLAVINSRTESKLLWKILNKENETGHTYVGFKKYYDGEWATIYGDTLAEAGFSDWSPYEPNNATGKETCGSIFPGNGLLNDAQCSEARAFICEFPL